MSTNSNVSPLIRLYISCMTLMASNPESHQELKVLDELQSELEETLFSKDSPDFVEEMLGMSIALMKFALLAKEGERELYDEFTLTTQKLALWLEVVSEERTLLDSIDMENSFIDWIEEQKNGDFDVER